MIRLLFLLLSLARAELVSTGVGLVKGQVITSREVQIQNILENVLYEKTPTSKIKQLSLDSKAFNKATQESLLETVVALEAQSFNVIQISPEDVKEAEKQVNSALKNNKVWQSLEVSKVELEKALRFKIQAKRFIQFRSQSSVLPVTDSEAQRYFTENPLKFGNLPFENLKENIKSYLSKAQVDRRLKDWFEVLLSKYQVKNLIAEM